MMILPFPVTKNSLSLTGRSCVHHDKVVNGESKLKIGIGLSAYKRYDAVSSFCQNLSNLIAHSTQYQIKVVVADDGSPQQQETCGFELIKGVNKGVAVNKNRLLNSLKDCDYLFIVEDDVEFINLEFIDQFIEYVNQTGFQSLNYGPIEGCRQSKMWKVTGTTEQYGVPLIKYIANPFYQNDLRSYREYLYVAGHFHAITNQCLQAAGGLSSQFIQAGFGHMEWSLRMSYLGLAPDTLHCYYTLDLSDSIRILETNSHPREGIFVNHNKSLYDYYLHRLDRTDTDYLTHNKLHLADNSHNEKVSVVIPLYNKARQLFHVLHALNNQNYDVSNIEIIVVDDGSSDEFQQVIADIKKNELFRIPITLIRQSDKGYRLSRARNLGIKKAPFDTIILLDADMVPHIDFVRRLVESHQIDKGCLLLSWRKHIEEDSLKAEYVINKKQYLILDKLVKETNRKEWRLVQYERNCYLRDEKEPWWFCCGGHILFSKKLAFKCGLFDESYTSWGAEDCDFAYRYMKVGGTIRAVMGSYAYHIDHFIDEEKQKQSQITNRNKFLASMNNPIKEVACEQHCLSIGT